MKEKTFYRALIEDDFWPYWEKYVDTTHGGIMNCINNDGDRIISERKYSWSQGRFLWILGSMYQLAEKGELSTDLSKLTQYMNQTQSFIENYCLLEDYSTVFLLERDGTPILDEITGRYDTSIYSDCFVILGLCKYAQVNQDESICDLLLKILSRTMEKIEGPSFYTEPYPIPQGYETHAVNMIMVNTLSEVISTMKLLKRGYGQFNEIAQNTVKRILVDLYDDGYIREYVKDEETKYTRLLDSHINPGHTLECMWFIIEYLEENQDIQQYLEKIGELSINAFDTGWDSKFGGLLRFVDRNGNAPNGENGGSAFEKLILDTHEMKLWWPQSEALIIFHKLFLLTGEEAYLERYEKMKAYAFEVFPNKEIGEWIQIRLRDGKPMDKVVALPVKDPFHILRAYIKIIESEAKKCN